jgi:hypothetical protein
VSAFARRSVRLARYTHLFQVEHVRLTPERLTRPQPVHRRPGRRTRELTQSL